MLAQLMPDRHLFRRPNSPRRPRLPGEALPGSLLGFIWRVSGTHQFGLAALSILLFLVGTAPLELQRRIVNVATERGPYASIVRLAALYVGLAVAEGSTKLGLNMYRNWVGESAVRWLRLSIFERARAADESFPATAMEGTQLSIVIAEAEPIGGFVGDSISEPLLQFGILGAVTAYLIYLQPFMAIVVAIVFAPQIGFVPLMQGAINRRVQEKIAVMRHVSEGIVAAGSAVDADGSQHGRIQSIFSINMGIYKLKFSMNFLMNLMTQLGYVGILALGGYFVVAGRIEVGTVVAFISGLSKINDPWGDLVDWYRNVRVTQVKYDMVLDATERGGPLLQAGDTTAAQS